jgi:ribonuclease P protein component
VIDRSFSRENRLLNAEDYSRVFGSADGKASHRYVLLLARRNHLQRNRLGLVVAKKHVKLAVQRNRFKRIAREFFRHCQPMDTSLDVVVLARKGVDRLDNDTLSTILRQQWTKLTGSLISPADQASS